MQIVDAIQIVYVMQLVKYMQVVRDSKLAVKDMQTVNIIKAGTIQIVYIKQSWLEIPGKGRKLHTGGNMKTGQMGMEQIVGRNGLKITLSAPLNPLKFNCFSQCGG